LPCKLYFLIVVGGFATNCILFFAPFFFLFFIGVALPQLVFFAPFFATNGSKFYIFYKEFIDYFLVLFFALLWLLCFCF
jgi:hypothetical protein